MGENGVRGAAADTGGAGASGEAPRGRPPGSGGEEGHRNEVLLVGRVTAEPVFRETASGGRLAAWRMCVGRPPREGAARRSDAVYCVGFDTGLHPQVGQWRLGDVVRVTGALRRRVWHGRGDVRSMYEVEACTAALVRRARPASGPPPAEDRDAGAVPAAGPGAGRAVSAARGSGRGSGR
ncbi:single-stranded DNA-binding protein [Nocardiopsis flavescens]|uniref:single-stranded DNA-binding protein n=1 Tax=Nocardiopsis flavescens TaxID=758803 RepID=UPI0036480BC1